MQKHNISIIINNTNRGQMVSICSVRQVQPGWLIIRHGGTVGPLADVLSQINDQPLPVVVVGNHQSKNSSGFTRFFAPAQLMCKVSGWQLPGGRVEPKDMVAVAFVPEWGAVPLTLHSIRDRDCAAAARLAVSLRGGSVRIVNGENDLVRAIEWGNINPERPVFETENCKNTQPNYSI
jgi:hypothetical protein